MTSCGSFDRGLTEPLLRGCAKGSVAAPLILAKPPVAPRPSEGPLDDPGRAGALERALWPPGALQPPAGMAVLEASELVPLMPGIGGNGAKPRARAGRGRTPGARRQAARPLPTSRMRQRHRQCRLSTLSMKMLELLERCATSCSAIIAIRLSLARSEGNFKQPHVALRASGMAEPFHDERFDCGHGCALYRGRWNGRDHGCCSMLLRARCK